MVSKRRIKPGVIVKIKTWDELKKLHGSKLIENNSYRSLREFLKLHAGKKRTVFDVKYSPVIDELKIYVEKDGMYFLLKEIASVNTEIELDDSLFEI